MLSWLKDLSIFWTLVSAFGLLAPQDFAYAKTFEEVLRGTLPQESCSEMLGQNPIFGPLTQDMKRLLLMHPVWSKYSGVDGNGLQFVFRFPDADPASNAPSYLKADEIKTGSKGESIQAHFVAQTLRMIFPAATFYGSPMTGKRRIFEISIEDPAENGFQSMRAYVYKYGRSNVEYLSMPLLKLANGRGVETPKMELRARMGVERDRRVVNLYNFELSGMDTLELIHDAASILPMSKAIFIVTRRYVNNPAEGEISIRTTFGSRYQGVAKVHQLSKLQAGELSTEGPHIVINDTVGLMPALQRMADASIVGGPVNIFEGINAGTPTVFQNKLEEGKGYQYSNEVFSVLANAAIASGGGFPYSSKEELLLSLQKALQTSSAPTPSYLVTNRGKTWFEHYLYVLKSMLDRKL